MGAMARSTIQEPEVARLGAALGTLAHRLESARDLDPLLQRVGSARFVLIGEASHGTSEFYRWRALLTQRLIEEKGFTCVAVEGDWAECLAAHQFAMGRSGNQAAGELARIFTRWPTWMWANHEVAEFLEWLQSYNSMLPREKKVGFYGLDVYGMWESLDALRQFAQRHDDAVMRACVQRLDGCLRPYDRDAQSYGFSAKFAMADCAAPASELFAHMHERWLRTQYEEDFYASQHAFVVMNAERYYRAMYRSDAQSWNIRDTHMADTLDRMAHQYGPSAKVVVWEHNTHVGDARYTDMTWANEVNVGQLMRERHGRNAVALVGFGTYEGSVIAARAWGEAMRHMLVPPARQQSWEHLLHIATPAPALLLSHDLLTLPNATHPRGHRAIGVVYDPLNEKGNYVPTTLPLRYDAFLYLPMTTALHPLHAFRGEEGELPQLYPTGV